MLPHSSLRWTFATTVCALTLSGCGSSGSSEDEVARARPDAATDETSFADAGDVSLAEDGADDLGRTESDSGVADDTGLIADTGTVAAEDTSPPDVADSGSTPTTWRCAESDTTCARYDTESGPGYTKPACTNVYPCCVRFVVARDAGGSYRGCSCYSDAYLGGVGRSCSGQVDNINATPAYSGAVTTPSCPGS